MHPPKYLSITLAALLLSCAGSAFAKKQDFPEITEDGLHLVPDSKMALVYAEPGAELTQYKRIQLMDAYVAFKKNWQLKQRRSITTERISDKDMEKIKNSLAEEFHTVFREALEEGGYEVVDEAGDDVLLVRPAIINLDVNATDTASGGVRMSATTSAGEMTLYIELYDSVTGDMIAKAMERRIDKSIMRAGTWTNSETNKAAAKRILKGWAAILLNALNEAKQP